MYFIGSQLAHGVSVFGNVLRHGLSACCRTLPPMERESNHSVLGPTRLASGGPAQWTRVEVARRNPPHSHSECENTPLEAWRCSSFSGCLWGSHGSARLHRQAHRVTRKGYPMEMFCFHLGVCCAHDSESRRDRLLQLSAEHGGSCWLCRQTPGPPEEWPLHSHTAVARSKGGHGLPCFTVANAQHNKYKYLGGWRW